MDPALLVCAAPLPGHRRYYQTLISSWAGQVIAVDAGADLCHTSARPPDVLVGDFDSISAIAHEYARGAGALLRSAPAEKDVTDLDLALGVARELGLERVVVTAAWSGRLDHTISALGSVLADTSLTVDLLDPGTTGCVLDARGREAVMLEGPGATFSLFAATSHVNVSCTGVRYPLDHADLPPLASLGVSNVVIADDALVRAEVGRLLVLSHAVSTIGPARMADHRY
jgi:thiamine pyrophosphokinase